MIHFDKLTKRFGRTLALNTFELTVTDGELHGFVGPNGAGKTTAMKILATLERATGGDVSIDGVSVKGNPQRARMMMGYMPDFFGVYDNLKAWEYLDFYAGCMGIEGKARRKRIEEMLELTALSSKREEYVDSLSRGMKQRLCLARALMHDPGLLILDEPASGMDPRARAQMRDIVKSVCAQGKTVLISSHILPELADMCDHITILEAGRAAFTGTTQELDRKMCDTGALVLRFAQEPAKETLEKVHALIREVLDVDAQQKDGVMRAPCAEDAARDARLLSGIMSLGVPVCEFARERVTLEKAFLEVTHE